MNETMHVNALQKTLTQHKPVFKEHTNTFVTTKSYEFTSARMSFSHSKQSK